jgi:hypothetical protein
LIGFLGRATPRTRHRSSAKRRPATIWRGSVSFLAPIALTVVLGACVAPPPTESPPGPTPVQASPNPNLVEFESHLREATARQGQLVRELSTATTGSAQQLAQAARHLTDWTAAEQLWLQAHPADACFEGAWQTYASSVDDMATAAAAIDELAAAAASPSASAGEVAGALLANGTETMKLAADLAYQARAAC